MPLLRCQMVVDLVFWIGILWACIWSVKQHLYLTDLCRAFNILLLTGPGVEKRTILFSSSSNTKCVCPLEWHKRLPCRSRAWFGLARFTWFWFWTPEFNLANKTVIKWSRRRVSKSKVIVEGVDRHKQNKKSNLSSNGVTVGRGFLHSAQQTTPTNQNQPTFHCTT